MTCPGGKSGAGVYQAIINQMPPHRVYIEPFLGGAGVMRRKRQAGVNVGVDLDPDVIATARAGLPKGAYELLNMSAFEALNLWQPEHDWLIYLDPPYPMSCRSSDRPIYKHEIGDLDHAVLLSIARELPCMVMVSSYDNPLYNERLADWRRVEFQGITRGGPRTEVLWCNFPEPKALHDYQYLGADYRQRERIARKVRRFRAKFDALPELERLAILSSLAAVPAGEDRQL